MTDQRRLERSCLLIADLSGYTPYLAASEPEQGPLIAGDFLETVVARLRPLFRLVKLEGDAAFMWAPLERIDGNLLLDVVDLAYQAFQRRLQSVSVATDCGCEACSRMPQLDLKFVVHVGDVLRQRIAGREELAGRDVIIAHRLLKGTADRGGARSYVLLTDATMQALDLDAVALGMTTVSEMYEALGIVHGQLLDLGERWRGEHQRAARSRSAGRLIGRLERLMPSAPEVVWEHLTSPSLRSTWEGIEIVGESARGGRDIGTTASCVVSKLETVEEILDWRPFSLFARRSSPGEPGRTTAVYRLSPTATGTHVEVSWFARGRSTDEAARRLREDLFMRGQEAALDRLVSTLKRRTDPTDVEV
jgi:uncharacterized protein YndB with AHSA1/START domain